MDEFLVVDEVQIADGMRQLYRGDHLVAEGGASVGVAALIAGLVREPEGNRSQGLDRINVNTRPKSAKLNPIATAISNRRTAREAATSRNSGFR